MWFWTGLFLVMGGLAGLFLYRRGIVAAKSIRAVLFVFRPGKNTDRVAADRCTGWVSHAGRFSESGVYSFTLDARLSQGEVQVLLLDRKKQPLLKLDRQAFTGQVELDRKSRYVLRWELKSATGSCALRWERAV